MLTPGSWLQNRYQIVRLIGQGGMGAVYEAEDQRLGNRVALKKTLVHEKSLRRAFEREARILARLHHPMLPGVIDHFTEGSDQYLVMRYIPGDDLGTLVNQQGAQPLGKVLKWGDQLLDVLDYLHSHQPPIVHRDIKPHNLKLTAHGDIILLDFGLAKGGQIDQSRVTTTDNRSIFGYTPHYAPLEQIQGTGTHPGSDLYALGATLYHLVTGSPPPDALERARCVLANQPDPLTPAHVVNPNLPQALGELLMQAMAQNPNQRPTSAAQMRQRWHQLDQQNRPLNQQAPAARQKANPARSAPASSEAPTAIWTTPETINPDTNPQTSPSYNHQRPRLLAFAGIALILLCLIVTIGGSWAFGLLGEGDTAHNAPPTSSIAQLPPTFAPPTITPPPAFTRNLFLTTSETPRINGQDVEALQRRLRDLNYTEIGEIDGFFGPLTEAAVKNFQTKNQLEIDGIVGQTTWERLFSEQAMPKSP